MVFSLALLFRKGRNARMGLVITSRYTRRGFFPLPSSFFFLSLFNDDISQAMAEGMFCPLHSFLAT